MRAATLLAALFLAPIIGGGFGELPVSVVALLTLSGVIAQLLVSQNNTGAFPRPPGLRLLILLLVVTGFSTAFSHSIYHSLRHIMLLCSFTAGYALSSALCRDRRIAAAAVWTLAISALAICLAGIQDYAILQGGGRDFWKSILSSGTHDRLFGPFANPSFFAGFLVIALPVTLGVYLGTRTWPFAALAGLAVVLETLALMLTGTKFGILAALVALVVLFGLAIPTGALKRAKFKRVLIIAAVLFPLLIVFRGTVTSRIAAAESGGSQVHSTEFRRYTWAGAVRMAVKHPWLGVGPGAFEEAYPRFALAGFTTHAHQSYLQTAAETGIPALLILLGALAAVFWAGISGILKHRRAAAEPHGETDAESSASQLWKDLLPFSAWPIVNCAVFAALVGSLVRNLADSDWYVLGTGFSFWVMAGVLAAQSGSSGAARKAGTLGRSLILAGCLAVMLISISLGLGDLAAPKDSSDTSTPDRIIAGYRTASALSPLNPAYHREMAKWLVIAGRTTEAAEQINRAIALSPWDSSNYYVKGVVAIADDRPADAEKAFLQALARNPNSTQVLLRLAQIRFARGDTRGAEQAYYKLLNIEESDAERVKGVPELVDTAYAYAHVYFGRKYLAAKRYRRAEAEFRAAVKRLERWRSNEDLLSMRRAIGALTQEEENQTMELLASAYLGLADTYQGFGEAEKAKQSRGRAERLLGSLD